MLPHDPDFVPHEPQTYELASIGSRFVANFLDGLLLGFTLYLINELLFDGNFAINVVGQFIYHWYFWTQRDGQTPGKAAMNIQVIKVDGSPINGVDVLLRYLGYTVSGLVLGLGYIWAIFDDNNQGWHDKMAGTYVVRAMDRPAKRVIVGE